MLNKSLSSFNETDNEEKFLIWLAVICNRATSAYLKKFFYNQLIEKDVNEYKDFLFGIQPKNRWELYEETVSTIRQNNKDGKNLERNINLFMLYLWADFSPAMINLQPCYKNLGQRVLDNVINRLRKIFIKN